MGNQPPTIEANGNVVLHGHNHRPSGGSLSSLMSPSVSPGADCKTDANGGPTSPASLSHDDSTGHHHHAPKESLAQLKTFWEKKYKKDGAVSLANSVAGSESQSKNGTMNENMRKHFNKRMNFFKELEMVVGSRGPSDGTTGPISNRGSIIIDSTHRTTDSVSSISGDHKNGSGDTPVAPKPLVHSMSMSLSDISQLDDANRTAIGRTDTDSSRSGSVSESTRIRDGTVVLDGQPELTADEKRLLKRQKVVQEIIASEKLYAKFLQLLIDCFYAPMQLICTPEQLEVIFSNIVSIAPLHKMVAEELAAAPQVAFVFKKYVHYLKMYTPYINNYEKALAMLNKMKSDAHFNQFMAASREDEQTGGLDLTSFLIMPIQRIPRYRLLLEQLKKYTPDDDPETPTLNEALATVMSIADSVNESKRQLEALTTLTAIQSRISGNFNLIAPSRHLIREAEVIRKKTSSKPIHIFLFNDILLWTSPAPSYDFKGVLKLNTASLKDYKHKDRVGFIISAPAMPQDLCLTFPVGMNVGFWKKCFQDAIDEAKQKTEQQRSRTHARRTDMHNQIQAQLHNLSGTLKRKMLSAQLLKAVQSGDQQAIEALERQIQAQEKEAGLLDDPHDDAEHSKNSASLDYQEEKSVTVDSDDETSVADAADSVAAVAAAAKVINHEDSDTDEETPERREKRLSTAKSSNNSLPDAASPPPPPPPNDEPEPPLDPPPPTAAAVAAPTPVAPGSRSFASRLAAGKAARSTAVAGKAAPVKSAAGKSAAAPASRPASGAGSRPASAASSRSSSPPPRPPSASKPAATASTVARTGTTVRPGPTPALAAAAAKFKPPPPPGPPPPHAKGKAKIAPAKK